MVDRLNTESALDSIQTRRAFEVESISSIATNAFLILLCFIAALVSFWDVRFTFDKAFNVSFVTILLYIVATTVFRTKYDGGLFKGKQTNEYKDALNAFTEKRKKILDCELTDDLREWCNDFRRKDLDNVRKNIVCPYMAFSEYLKKYEMLDDAQINALPLPKMVKKALIAANKTEPIDLTSDMLLNLSFSKTFFGKRKILPCSGDEKKRIDIITDYAKRFVVTFICGMFLVEIVSNPTFDTFLQWTIRMIPVVTAFITAPAGGFKNATEIAPKRMNAQAEMLTAFLQSVKKRNNEKTTPIHADSAGNRDDKISGELQRAADQDL